MTPRSLIELRHDESGMSLVELIIVVVALGALSTVIAMTFINGMISQQSTAARDLATGRASVITETLADSVRNSLAIRVNADGTRVDATVLLPDNTLQCRAWAINASKELVYRTGSSSITASVDTWGALAESVSGALPATAPSPAKAFSPAGGRSLDIGLGFGPKTGTSGEQIVFRSKVAAQAKFEGAVTACS